MCEQIRALVANLTAMQNQWFLGTNALITNDASPVVDNRAAEGIIELTGADVNSVMNIVSALITANNAQIIQKPCVRPLGAS